MDCSRRPRAIYPHVFTSRLFLILMRIGRSEFLTSPSQDNQEGESLRDANHMPHSLVSVYQ